MKTHIVITVCALAATGELCMCSESPQNRNGVTRPAESAPVMMAREEAPPFRKNAHPRDFVNVEPTGACGDAYLHLKAIGCEGLDNFISACHHNTHGEKERVAITDNRPGCLAKATSIETANACSSNFRCVVKKEYTVATTQKPFVRK